MLEDKESKKKEVEVTEEKKAENEEKEEEKAEGEVDVKEGEGGVEEKEAEEKGEEEEEKEESEEKVEKVDEEKKEMPEGPKKSVFGLDENIAGALAYLGMVITGILFLLLEKENRFVRFHAMQSIVIFLPAIIVIRVLDWFFYYACFEWIIIRVLYLLLLLVWIVAMWKAYEGEYFKFPVAGDIAEKLLKDLKI